MDIKKLQRVIVDGLEDVKGQNIVVFNTEHLSSLFERVIIASGTSNRQTKALAASVRDAVKSSGFPVPRTEGEENGEWIIVDCGSAVVHLMQPSIREYYHLEELWGDKPVKLLLQATTTRLVKASEPDKPAAKKAAAKTLAAKKVAAKKVAAKKVAAKTVAAKTVTASKAVPVKKAAAKKSAARPTLAKRVAAATKTVSRKTAAKTAAKPGVTRVVGVKKVVSAKVSGTKTPARKAPAKKMSATETPVTKAPVKKASAKKVPAKTAAAKKAKPGV